MLQCKDMVDIFIFVQHCIHVRADMLHIIATDRWRNLCKILIWCKENEMRGILGAIFCIEFDWLWLIDRLINWLIDWSIHPSIHSFILISDPSLCPRLASILSAEVSSISTRFCELLSSMAGQTDEANAIITNIYLEVSCAYNAICLFMW